MKPSVGRVVHYVSHGTPIRGDGSQAFTSECRAAIVTEVSPLDDYLVGVAVLNPTGIFLHPIHLLHNGGVLFDEGESVAHWSCDGRGHIGGSWHWPERVEE